MICFATMLHGQTFLTVKSIKYENNRVSAYNVQGYVVYQVDCKDFVWQRNPDLTIKIWDDIHSYTVNSTSLTSPAWAVVEDSLRAWQTACSVSGGGGGATIVGNLDSTHQDTSMIVPFLIESLLANQNKDTSNLYMLNSIYNELINIAYDTTQTDTSLVINSLIENFSDRSNDTLSAILQSIKGSQNLDTSNLWLLTYIYDEIYNMNSRGFDSSQTDTSLVVPFMLENILINQNKDTSNNYVLSGIYSELQYLNSRTYDTSQIDTSTINYIAQFDRQNDTLSAILQSLSNSSGNDTSNYWILDSIFNELKQTDTFCLTGELGVKDSLLRTTIVDCNGSNALNVKICNSDTTQNLLLSQKIDTTNINLLSIIDSLAALTTIVNELQLDCIGSNETYYIDGTNSITLNASEICSYTITVIGGDVDFSENGVSSPFSLPNGYTGSNYFKSGTKYLVNQVVFTGNSGSSKAIIKIIK